MTVPTVTATGRRSLAIANLIESIADSSTFRTWVGAANNTEAKESIWVEDTEQEMETLRPYAIIASETLMERNIATGPVDTFDETGALSVMLEANTPSGKAGEPGDYRDNVGNAATWFQNQIDAVWSEVRAKAHEAGYLNVVALEHEFAMESADAEQEGGTKYWCAKTRVEYR